MSYAQTTEENTQNHAESCSGPFNTDSIGNLVDGDLASLSVGVASLPRSSSREGYFGRGTESLNQKRVQERAPIAGGSSCLSPLESRMAILIWTEPVVGSFFPYGHLFAGRWLHLAVCSPYSFNICWQKAVNDRMDIFWYGQKNYVTYGFPGAHKRLHLRQQHRVIPILLGSPDAARAQNNLHTLRVARLF